MSVSILIDYASHLFAPRISYVVRQTSEKLRRTAAARHRLTAWLDKVLLT